MSALGWLTAVKGFLLVAFPATVISLAADAMGAVSVWRGVYVAFAVLGCLSGVCGVGAGGAGACAAGVECGLGVAGRGVTPEVTQDTGVGDDL